MNKDQVEVDPRSNQNELFHSLHWRAHCRKEDLSQFFCVLQLKDDYECESNAADKTPEDLNIPKSLGMRFCWWRDPDKGIEKRTMHVDLYLTESLGMRRDDDNEERLKERGGEGKSLAASPSSSVGWVWPTLDFTQSTPQNPNDSHRKANYKSSSYKKTDYGKIKFRKVNKIFKWKSNSIERSIHRHRLDLLKWIIRIVFFCEYHFWPLLNHFEPLQKSCCDEYIIVHARCVSGRCRCRSACPRFYAKAWKIAQFRILCQGMKSSTMHTRVLQQCVRIEAL